MLANLMHNCIVCIVGGWLGEAKVSCTLRHQGVQLILAYSAPRPAVLAADKGGGGVGGGGAVCVSSLSFIFISPLSHLFHLLYYLFYLSSPFLFLPFPGGRHKMTHKG